MEKLVDYKDIKDSHRSYLLFGNGLAMSFSSEFGYKSLYDLCSLEESSSGPMFSAEALQVFKDFDSTNFEWILYALDLTKKINETLYVDNDKTGEVYENIKHSLIKAVHRVHIGFDEIRRYQLERLGKIFASFNKGIFTTNYDLITYWALMENKNKLADLFFQHSTFNIKATTPYNGKKPVHFLHGALHLYKENGATKKVFRESGSLLERIDETMSNHKTPLFVSEGTSDQKLRTITSNEYLHHCYKKLFQLSGGITIFGHSLAKEDNHIVEAIRQSNVERIAYGVHTSRRDQKDIDREIAKINSKFKSKTVTFFQSNSFFDSV
ncbi:DUF4917 family protein [Salimicrobium album]|uniref:DUF4917 family protein n=1 Tax=Salimicrobium album TaxID=50717 RepID=A0A1H3DGW7_9BACI|nr:DUF4917 family protein [Salimicrobium album]SDX65646.1 protein of unknown function [Salimicrobium album]